MGCGPRARSVLHCHGALAQQRGPVTGAVQDASQLQEDASWQLAVQKGRQSQGLEVVQKATFGTVSRSKPTFQRSGPQIIVQTQCFATFLPFRHLHSSDPLSSLLFLLLLCSCLTPPISTFSICPSCAKFDFETSFAYILDVLLR